MDNNDDEMDIISKANNLKYLIKLKDDEIESLKREKKENLNSINSLKLEIANLKLESKKKIQLEIKLKESQDKCSDLKKEIISLNNRMLEINKKNKEEKRKLEKNYSTQILNYKKIEAEKFLTENIHQIEKDELMNEIYELKTENDKINKKMTNINNNQKIINEIKISNLKKCLIKNINNTQKQAKELNLEYTNETAKLILFQNHQLLMQLEYQSQQIEEMNAKNKILNDKIYALLREVEIHKNVELSLAEKNKKLKEQLNNNKINNIKTNSFINKLNEEKIQLENNYDVSTNINNNSNCNTDRCILKTFSSVKMRNSMKDLENKLKIKQNEFNDLKEKNDLFENILKNYQKKYNGLFNYFEDCLKLFFNDADLKNNKNIYINMNSIKKGDFTSLTKEEKYSALIILMKYLLPLINSTQLKNESKDFNLEKSRINNINLKFYSLKNERVNNDNTFKKISICKSLLFNKIKNSKIYEKNNSSKNLISSSDYLPSIN